MDHTGAQPTAWSVDGVTFRYRGPIGAGLQLGGYVMIGDGSEPRLGQVLAQDVALHPAGFLVEGAGHIVGPGAGPFGASALASARPEHLHEVLDAVRAPLDVGGLTTAPDVRAVLDARGFNRHTFLCGQSGSGKTYALGLILERLVLRTRLPLLVLDPNGDHVHLGTPAPGVDDATAGTYTAAAADVRVLAAEGVAGVDLLRIRLGELSAGSAAALLQLDPIRDRDEYNALLHLRRDGPAAGFDTVDEAMSAFRASGDEVAELIRKRVENLGVDAMRVWAGRSARTIADVWVHDRPRALIADTSAFEERRERLAVALAVLESLWAVRKERRPLLLVVDEAHDVCPADPSDPLERAAVDVFTRVAGEGRKYGIHLLLASQRPDKLPDNVLSQCDNLVLMRVNSTGDRAALATRFGFAPPALVDRAGDFGLGQALFAGRIAPTPVLATIGARITPEGGADVPTDWAG